MSAPQAGTAEMDFFNTFKTEATEPDSCLFVEPRQASFRLETQPVVVFAKSSASGATEVEVSWTPSNPFSPGGPILDHPST